MFGVPTSGHGRLLLRLRAEGIGGGVAPQEDPRLEAREEEEDNSWRRQGVRRRCEKLPRSQFYEMMKYSLSTSIPTYPCRNLHI